MGIEMRLHVLDGTTLLSLLSLEWNELISKMNSSELRNLRPEEDKRLIRSFDIDCEADFLDLAESISGNGSTKEVLANNRGYEALLKLVEWCSCGYWEAWEGRCIMYFENALGRSISNVDDMYEDETWAEVCTNLMSMDEVEFSEKVCENWMERRKELGETLDENQDPRIIPTFEAHNRNSRGLHYAVNLSGWVKILGREHLSADKWGHGEWNLETLLHS
ncbi:MAG: hypothetical protein QGI21_05845 [Candidatus Poseidoniaceae archaeon]|jgi:hypothetical protein|nr:hypothetical protein [Candidatus Poseidoniaceae archaeon]